MSSPLEFLKIFAGQMRQAGISFAITSGMACVHYGLQQNTKDSDWIIPADDLEALRRMLTRLEGELPPWRVSYRQICGAPLEAEYMRHGWTSHLSIWDTAGSVEHKVDIFSKPPRVRMEELIVDPDGWASQHVVAQMKKTDRDKDWPIVNGLGQRLLDANLDSGLLHIRDLDVLEPAWKLLAPEAKDELAQRRPLLKCFARLPPPTRGQVELLLMLERLVWERVNHQRHSRYTRNWKDFYRAWRKEENWVWPTEESFERQHARLFTAAQNHGLLLDPLAEISRTNLVAAAVEELRQMERFTDQDIDSVLPLAEDLLP